MADLNFYKNAVKELSAKGHKITFTVLNRGRLPQVAKTEFAGYEQIVFGKHRSSLLGKIFGIICRELRFLGLYIRRRFNVVTSFGFYPGLFARLLGMRAVQFHDDKEYKLNYKLTKLFASRFVSLCPTEESKKVRYAKSSKELACLHPSRYKEDVRILKYLNVTKERYVYVRDIKQVSLNYADHQHVDYQLFFDFLVEKGYKIIYNAEAEKNPYKGAKLIVSKFSYEEITALKKYAALVISSGDTELREAALLGTPVIYTSDRDMLVNKPLEKAGLFQRALTAEELLKKGKALLGKGVKNALQEKASAFVKKYEDMTGIIVEELEA